MNRLNFDTIKMMNNETSAFNFIIFFLSLLLFFEACKRQPYSPDFNEADGYVIGKETCNTDETKDYWLIDFTYDSNAPQYGDTLILNGITYTNVIKTKDLDKKLKQIGLRVFIDFKTITSDKIETTGCNVSTPETYKLKELFIISQGEIR